MALLSSPNKEVAVESEGLRRHLYMLMRKNELDWGYHVFIV